MNVGWFYDPLFLRHDPGPSHVESAARLVVIVQALQHAGVMASLLPMVFRAAMTSEMELVHEPAYVNLVRMMCDEGFSFVGTEDTRISACSYDVAAKAVGAVVAACDAVMAGRISRAFCAVRPPGHHAEPDQALGFCLFNNIAIGAEYLLQRHGLSRVAIVDIDAHHGNGTQHIFAERPDVLYVSLHERPGSLPFPGSGDGADKGFGLGEGYTLNVPLSRGSDEDIYLDALQHTVVPLLEQHQPELLLISAGFDALAGDPLCHLALQPSSYDAITQVLTQAANRCAQGRVISVLEGGYHLDLLGPAVCAHIQALLRP